MARIGSPGTCALLSALLLLGCGNDRGRPASAAAAAPLTSSAPALVTSASAAPSTSATPSPQPLAQGTLHALSYNVQGVPRGLLQITPVTALQRISPKLNGFDLVLVQEDFWFHHALERDARHPFRSAPQRGYSGVSNDGLNRFSDEPFLSFSRTRWQDRHGLNDRLSSKGFSFARHELAPGVTVDVYNHHADAGRGAKDIDARRSQFRQLKDFILNVSANQAVIVAGDTNLSSAEPRDMLVLTSFLSEANLRDVARTVGTAPEKIDRFLFRSGPKVKLKPLRWRIADEFDAGGGPPSDHEAIHVDFEWRLVP